MDWDREETLNTPEKRWCEVDYKNMRMGVKLKITKSLLKRLKNVNEQG